MRRICTQTLSVLLAAIMLSALLIMPACAADPCETILAGMNTEEKISQMIMPEFRYFTDGAGKNQPLEEITPDVEAILQKRGFAGVVFFAQNAGETAKTVRLVDAVQTANASVQGRPQLLTAIDQEGGIVTRLGQGTQTPGNMALGAVGDLTATEEIATIIGQELGAIGFNFDFAPVVDVNNNPANPVIGVRSFSDDPQIVAEQGAAYMHALQATGTISTLKHFPGHGDTATDSHTGLPCVDKSYDALKQIELVPFQACIDAGAEAVMTAHIQYPQVEAGTYTSIETGEEITLPATLSKTILTDILRGDMGFAGVIVTDALSMDAIAKHFDRLDTARLAIEAGVDILLMPVDTSTKEGIDALDQYITDVAGLADAGAISLDKVDAAVLRILRLKEKKGLLTPYESGDMDARLSQAAAQVGSKDHHAREWEITKRAITLVKNENNVLPLTQAGQKIAVLTSYDNETMGMEYAVGLLRDEGKLPEGAAVSVRSIQKLDFAAVQPLIEDADHVIVVSEVKNAAALDPNNEKGSYSALVDQIIKWVHQNGKTITVLSAQLPYDAARYQDADALLIAWSAKSMSEDPRVTDGAVKQYGPNMPAALYLALSPDESPAGRLPVNIPALDDAYQYTDKVLYARGFGLTYQTGSRFVDVPTDAYYADAVDWAVDQGITTGTEETHFSPNAPCTRAQMVTFLWREAGSPEPVSEAPFTDVSSDVYYAKAVAWAMDQGITKGTGETTFSPSDTVTRAQTVAFLYRFAGASADASGVFDDVAPDAWYAEAVTWAAEKGITKGVDDAHFAPGDDCVRGQIVTFLFRFTEAG